MNSGAHGGPDGNTHLFHDDDNVPAGFVSVGSKSFGKPGDGRTHERAGQYFYAAYPDYNNAEPSADFEYCGNSEVEFQWIVDFQGTDYGYLINWEFVNCCDGNCEAVTNAPVTTDNSPTEAPTQAPTTQDLTTEESDLCCNFGDACIALEIHNRFRSKHSDTPCMTMEADLNSGAQWWADRLAEFNTFGHAPELNRPEQGENIWSTSHTNPAAAYGSEEIWAKLNIERAVQD